MNQDLKTRNALRLYIVVSLVGAAFFSPPYYSLLPLTLLTTNFYVWRRGLTNLDLAISFSSIFVTPLLFDTILGPNLPVLFSLPLLAYTDMLLRNGTDHRYLPRSKVSRRPTVLGMTLLGSLGAAGLLAVILVNRTLGLATIACLLYFLVVGVLTSWSVPRKPLRESNTFLRVLAGKEARRDIEILNLTKLGGYIYLSFTYSWIKVTPSALLLFGTKVRTTVSLVPPLAGPARPEMDVVVLDPWGLTQMKLKLQPVHLNVIPRARYADWLAKKYLETARPGRVFSQTPSRQLGSVHAARKGGEFYGARPYQAGDNLRVIDWKHSEKLGELIVQEFVESYSSSPLLVVNLSVSDEEEADKLAYCLITAALTLAKEGIPTAISAYNESAVVLLTDVLTPMQLVQKALSLTQSISQYRAPTRFLRFTDFYKLKVNLNRLKAIPSGPGERLTQLLSLEYNARKAVAESNPAAKAVAGGLARAKQITQLVIISSLNHDDEALSALAFNASSRGLKTLFLAVDSNLQRRQITTDPVSLLL